MKTFKQLSEELYINDIIELSETFADLSEEDIFELVEGGVISEEEGLFLLEITAKDVRDKVSDMGHSVMDTIQAGFGRGVVDRDRFKKWGGVIRSKIYGTSPEEEEKKIQKDYDIRSKRTPDGVRYGEKAGEVVRNVAVPLATGLGVTKVLKPAIGIVPAVVAGGIAGSAASNAMGDADKPESKSDTKPAELPSKPESKPDTKVAEPVSAPVKPVSAGGDAVRGPVKSSDDLERAKGLIKKREEAKSPIYKIGDVAGKMFGGGKEGESSVADTYRRLQQDPKAAAEFLKIQQQRNKEMGL